MNRIQIICPTYHRPQNLERLVREFGAAENIETIFVVHTEDLPTRIELQRLDQKYVIDFEKPSGVNASNRGYKAVTSEWFVLTQDDVVHHPGWLREASAAITTGITVVGFNDGATSWSTAWLMLRDQEFSPGNPGVVFNPNYTKNYADNELNDYAKHRGVFVYASNALAEHLHPGFGKAELDHTYKRLEDDVGKDAALYQSRRHLWMG
jgi:glycosyltransferase involved in cell wall biosynthesis